MATEAHPGRNGTGPVPTPLLALDVLTIAGTAVDMVASNTTIDRLVSFARGGPPELHFSRLVGTPGALPDPWNLKACTLTMQSRLVFSGTVQGYVDRYMDDFGWLREYRAFGLMYSGNYVPVTDALTFSDTSIWNQPGDDPMQVASRAGQTVGQIVAGVLTMQANANALSALGLGGYTSLSPPTLPSATTSDLAALTVIPQWVVRVAGERLLPALESFVQGFHPNHFLYVDVNGVIRFYDPRTFTDYSVTLNDPSDVRWDMPQLTRDATDNYSQVVVRGNTLVRAVTLQDAPWSGSTATDGGLQEDFAYGSLTNAAAKAAWTPSQWSQPNTNGLPMEVGACTCPDTLHVNITTSGTYTANQLAQGPGELLGWLVLHADSLGGLIDQFIQARIVANSATSGGVTACTLDTAMPGVSYNSYQLFGLAAGPNVVGRRYKVTNTAIAHALELAFPYPVPYVYANGTAAEMTTSPIGTVFYNATGSGPPYTSSTVGLTVDPVGGLVYFNEPVQVVVGGLMTPVRWPAVVQALLAVGVGALSVRAPTSGYAGTLYTVEGVQRTKTITVLEWKDISNNANMQTYASETLDAIKDVVVEGSLPYLGLPALDWLFPGRTVSLHGYDFTTGWEALKLPVVSVEVAFQNGPQGTSYVTTLQLSNRRTPYDAANFLRPNVSTQMLGGGGGGVFGAGVPEAVEASAQAQQEAARATAAATRPGFGLQGITPVAAQTVGGFGEAATAQAAGFGGAVGAQLGGFAGAAGAAAAGLGTSAQLAMAGMPTMEQAAGAGGPLGQRLYSPQEQQAIREEAAQRQEEQQRESAEMDRQRREREAELARPAPPQFIPRAD